MLSPTGPPERASLIIAIRGSEVTLTDGDSRDAGIAPHALFVGTVGGRNCWAVDDDGGVMGLDPQAEFVDLMRLYPQVDEPTWAAAGRAVQLVDWVRNHRYCGRCGSGTEESPGERARRCPHCGLLAFPRLAPAVITLVEREDGRVLLARNAGWRTGMYSCLAGFVEPGESIESAVSREVYEEVGIEVGDLRYYRSQPWPFPHSLMLGFEARYASGEIACDGTEIAEADWFACDDLPDLPPPMSIARWMIEDWTTRQRASA